MGKAFTAWPKRLAFAEAVQALSGALLGGLGLGAWGSEFRTQSLGLRVSLISGSLAAAQQGMRE